MPKQNQQKPSTGSILNLKIEKELRNEIAAAEDLKGW